MKNYLLDTNIISELIKPTPSTIVMQWLLAQPETSLFLSSITIAEIVRGGIRLKESKKRNKILQWARQEIPNKFSGRILEFDTECAFLWGEWLGKADREGQGFTVMDVQIATTATRFGLTLVTRNVKDMSRLPVKWFNPWEVEQVI